MQMQKIREYQWGIKTIWEYNKYNNKSSISAYKKGRNLNFRVAVIKAYYFKTSTYRFLYFLVNTSFFSTRTFKIKLSEKMKGLWDYHKINTNILRKYKLFFIKRIIIFKKEKCKS